MVEYLHIKGTAMILRNDIMLWVFSDHGKEYHHMGFWFEDVGDILLK